VASPSPRDEARINDALKKLCEEFHLGMVQGDEYRARRRRLLEGWADRDTTTAPGMSRARMAQAAAASAAKAAAPAGSGKRIAIGIGILVVAALVAYAVIAMRRPSASPPAPGTAPAAVNAAHLAQIRQAAIDFVERNQWEAPSLDDFLGRWRQLSPAERALALQEPSLRSLRYELQQNIQAATQMAAADADAAVRQRRDRLSAFAQELEGASQ